ncbi:MULTISPECIES: hypothetical protein [unclassified Mycobacterium]|uniref:hypothetical protein n=1 Tax=unclassified Mycobacterium TaxID=2642494 RepID=UPI00089A85CB|nr:MULTISPECIES: hypothetical protein [unclassified Mycobacterium]SEB02568.1 putative baseplate assembly protein [Mycobacterium sp. 283mftsu]
MPLPLPDLDDRRFDDLVDEAQALIHRYAPNWTDYNLSDPGITFIDLLAWMTEADVFATDQIPLRHRERFLALVGVLLRATVPARTPLALTSTVQPRKLPAGVVFSASTDGQLAVAHRLERSVEVLGCALTAVQVWDGTAFIDRTHDWQHRNAFDALGSDPAEGAALLLGFDPGPPLQPADCMTMWLELDDAAGSALEPGPNVSHHGAQTEWQYFNDGQQEWVGFEEAADDTVALTRTGRVVVPFGVLGTSTAAIGAITQPLRWIRLVVRHGRHDVAPRSRGIHTDAAVVVQSVPALAEWRFANPDQLPPVGFEVGKYVQFPITMNSTGSIVSLEGPVGPDDPQALVLAAKAGSITLTLGWGGIADGAPLYQGAVTGAPFTGDDVYIWSVDSNGSLRWTVVDTLQHSGAEDFHVEFDRMTGAIRFGDGERGRIPAKGSVLLIRAEQTRGVAGTPAPRTQWQLDTTHPLTVALMAGAVVDATTIGVRAADPTPARTADDVVAGEGRAAESVWVHERLAELAPPGSEATLDQLDRATVLSRARPERAVVAVDFERLAIDVPGTAVRRVRAWAGVDPALPGRHVPGTVTVIVVPGLPAQRPVPTPGLLSQIRQFLCPRRSLGTRLIVAGPQYVEVEARVVLQATRHADLDRVKADVESRLYSFLDPLTGGPAGRGWPFGRDVFRSEILRELDLVSGVDHVDELELLVDGIASGCGNLCVGATSLVVSGAHGVRVR